MSHTMRGTLLSLLLLLFCAHGCKQEETEFQGRPLSEWLEQAQSKDRRARMAAYDALRGFPTDESALRTLKEALANPQTPLDEKLVAARSLYRATSDAELVTEPVRSALRARAQAKTNNYPIKEIDDLVFWMREKARPLVPDLQYARDHVTGRDAASRKTRDDFDRIISSIPQS